MCSNASCSDYIRETNSGTVLTSSTLGNEHMNESLTSNDDKLFLIEDKNNKFHQFSSNTSKKKMKRQWPEMITKLNHQDNQILNELRSKFQKSSIKDNHHPILDFPYKPQEIECQQNKVERIKFLLRENRNLSIDHNTENSLTNTEQYLCLDKKYQSDATELRMKENKKNIEKESFEVAETGAVTNEVQVSISVAWKGYHIRNRIPKCATVFSDSENIYYIANKDNQSIICVLKFDETSQQKLDLSLLKQQELKWEIDTASDNIPPNTILGDNLNVIIKDNYIYAFRKRNYKEDNDKFYKIQLFDGFQESKPEVEIKKFQSFDLSIPKNYSRRKDYSFCNIADMIIYFGGYNPYSQFWIFYNDVWGYNIVNHRFFYFASKDDKMVYPRKRAGHSVVVYKQEMILFGGTDLENILHDLWSFNVFKNKWVKWNQLGPVPPGRYAHSSSIVKDTMIIFGGINSERVIMDDLWFFNLRSIRWSSITLTGVVPQPRFRHHSIVIHDTDLYIIHGVVQIPKENEKDLLSVKEEPLSSMNCYKLMIGNILMPMYTNSVFGLPINLPISNQNDILTTKVRNAIYQLRDERDIFLNQLIEYSELYHNINNQVYTLSTINAAQTKTIAKRDTIITTLNKRLCSVRQLLADLRFTVAYLLKQNQYQSKNEKKNVNYDAPSQIHPPPGFSQLDLHNSNQNAVLYNKKKQFQDSNCSNLTTTEPKQSVYREEIKEPKTRKSTKSNYNMYII